MNVTPEPYADIVETARQLVAHDATLTRYGKVPSTGYCVGGACRGIVLPIPGNGAARDSVIRRVALWIQAQPSHVAYFGSWTHNGAVYFDGVDIVDDAAVALALAAERGEIAVYDLTTGRLLEVQPAAA